METKNTQGRLKNIAILDNHEAADYISDWFPVELDWGNEICANAIGFSLGECIKECIETKKKMYG